MKKIFTKKLILAFVALIVLLGTGAAAFRALSSPISFAYYEPTYLPPHVKITDKRISITDNGTARAESAYLRLETVAWSYSIRQYKADSDTTIGDANQDYDASSVEPTCSIFETPKRQEYRLCHWVDDWTSHGGGKVSTYEIKFIKGSTYFWGDIPVAMNEKISVDDISRLIDSFKRKSTDGVRIERSRYFG